MGFQVETAQAGEDGVENDEVVLFAGFAVVSPVVVPLVFVVVMAAIGPVLMFLLLWAVGIGGSGLLFEVFFGQVGLLVVVDFYHFVMVEFPQTGQLAIRCLILHGLIIK